ncbi:MAG TPA: 2-succinyl-5-enolpyruvyl-6-hydroxy-3-cyclohexene-1-carboxylic-acid synthase, partial [Actinomycetota bacterium]
MSVADANRRLALTLVDELARAGLTDACLAPGSRSAPLAVALAEHPAIRLHVHVDERSAGFFALGAAKAAGRPAAVLCTSGTAAANLHPVVVEADHGRVPLLELTADRPPDLRATGANQAIDQLKLYGEGVRLFCEVGAPDESAAGPDDRGAGRYWRSLASRAWAAALGPPAGPVHLNIAFAEPLLPDPLSGTPAPGRPDGAPWTVVARPSLIPAPGEVAALADAVRTSPRGLLVVGWGTGVDPASVDAFATAAG